MSVRYAIVIAAFLSASIAAAGEKTVTLTEGELRAILASENAKAVAQYLAGTSAAAYDKVSKAFSPPPAPSAPPH